MNKIKHAYLWAATWTYIRAVRFTWYVERKADRFFGDRNLNGK